MPSEGLQRSGLSSASERFNKTDLSYTDEAYHRDLQGSSERPTSPLVEAEAGWAHPVSIIVGRAVAR